MEGVREWAIVEGAGAGMGLAFFGAVGGGGGGRVDGATSGRGGGMAMAGPAE